MTTAEPTVALGPPWPRTAHRTANGSLSIGGVAVTALAKRYGTPLYVFDEDTIRSSARQFREAFSAAYPQSRVVYAAKAFLVTGLVPILHEEGLGLDVVSGGELFVALRGGMPAHEISFHGNNKSRDELAEAIAAGVGKIVVDNDHEIALLADLVRRATAPARVMIRVNPGVDVHTHRKISTGVADSKFGFPIRDGQAESAIRKLASIKDIEVVGLHAHVGSQLFDAGATVAAIDELLDFAVSVQSVEGFTLQHLSPGGGFGIAYLDSDAPPSIREWAEIIANAVRTGCERRGLELPHLTVEPGRAIIGPAGVAIYEAGASKALAGIRTYLSVDGGMADNIRPALYEARYTAAVANRNAAPLSDSVTIAGKYCESGDLLIDEANLGAVSAGDLIAIPAAGAYTLSMASNYNYARRPAVAFVWDGAARLVRRRETYDDLVRTDL
jgi:diaminopimelate decarboxylase